MKIKILFWVLISFISSNIFANEVGSFLAISADDDVISYILADVQRINVIADSTSGSMVVVSKNGNEEGNYQEILFTSKITPVEEIDATSVYVFPNPVTNFLYVQGTTDVPNLKVYDLNGKCVLQEKASELEVATLSQGIYILQVNDKCVKFMKK